MGNRFFLERERFFSRVSANFLLLVFLLLVFLLLVFFLMFLLFFGGVFVLFGVFLCFSRVSAIFFFSFFSAAA